MNQLRTPLRAEGKNIIDADGVLVAEAISLKVAQIIVSFVNAMATQ